MRRILLTAALALAACSPDFDPASRIEKLRVVALRAEPPEIDPAAVQTADLTSLVLRADYVTTTRTTTVVHLACVPYPGSGVENPCLSVSTFLADPTAAIGAAARELCARPPGLPWAPVEVAGFEACVDGVCGPASDGGVPLAPARVALPAGFAFPASGVDRIVGVQAVDLAFAVDATPEELGLAGVGAACPVADVADRLSAYWAAREHVLTVKRVPIRGPASPNAANRNPAVDGIQATGATLDPAAPTTVLASNLLLTPVLPAGAAGQPEVYVKLDASGAPIDTETEEWVYSWFATSGELKDLHTRSATKADEWKVFSRGPARVVVVVRDLRGGTAWAVRDVVVE